MTFPPDRPLDYADRIAATHVAAEFPIALNHDARIDNISVGKLLELLANAAREGYINGVGVGA